MSDEITEELREYAAGRMTGPDLFKELEEMADRIDAAHDKALEAARYNPGGLNADGMTNEELEPYGLVRLPVDEDGVPWHVGDELRDIDGLLMHVTQLTLMPDGWRMHAEGRDGSGTHGLSVAPERARHHKPTPAERIRECAQDLSRGRCERPDLRLGDDLISTVAARLAQVADELEGGES